MTLSQALKRRYALSETGWKNLKGAVRASVIVDVVLMIPMMLTIMFIADIVGDNEYDYDLNLWIYAGLLALLLLCVGIAYRYEYNRCFFDTYQESTRVRLGLAERMRKLPLSFFSKKDPTDLSVRVMGDVAMQESMLSHWVPALVASLIFTPVIGLMTLIWSPLIGLAIVWPIPIAFAIVVMSGRIQKKYNRVKFERMEAVTEMIQESLECSDDLKANDAQATYMKRLNKELDGVESAEFRYEYICALFVVSAQLLLKLGMATTAVLGSILFINGELPLIMLIAAVVIVSRIYAPIDTSLMFLAATLSTHVNCERIQEINDMPLQGGNTDFSTDGYDIVFDHVGFSYVGGHKVLKDVSFTAKQGQVTALVGPSGEGKSTVARLCTRFWDIDSGKITLGGIDISTVDPESLMSKFSIVFQDVVLFNTSVMENIRIGRKGATDEEVMEAARKAQCDDFVSRLSEGYGTVIGENGGKLSGGERQRISIARAILKDAPIIIMDEATASLDTESESRVQQALSELISDKTVIIIAHRMRTVMEADKIVVLKGGSVVEQGSPEELRQRDGTFANMVRLQSGSGNWNIGGRGA
ncbi:MAG: ABC transporter ATP-binding protein [Candidatus Methanomethylophilaceae archaeon]|nr:ABC transporter ATP-binding protein [Candidatus Methanomethylophilaceae archaeon]MBR6870927.1 ABC transporter ATP-binding protein [Candidatus Methanomethylophilaceae archaeon]